MDKAGFRVSLFNEISVGSNIKYFVYVDLKECKNVRDLEKHIQNTFEIKEDIALFIGDNCLPKNETIHVIEPGDVLRLLVAEENNAKCDINKFDSYFNKTAEKKEISKESLVRDSDSCQGLSTKKTWMKKNSLDGIASCLEALRKTRSEEGRLETKICKQEENYEGMETDNLPVLDSGIKPKRKRKRKHKSKSVEGPMESDINNQNIYVEPQKTRKHFYFTDDDQLPGKTECFSEKFDDSEVPVVKLENGALKNENDSEKINGSLEEKNDDDLWKSNLLALANQPLERKVFHRNNSNQLQNSTVNTEDDDVIVLNNNINSYCKDFDPLQYPVVTSFKKNDIILFKMLKLGEDYSPTLSNNIMAKVKTVDEDTKQISILILRGFEEFDAPEGKFSLDSAETDAYKPQITYLSITDLLEPRLVFP